MPRFLLKASLLGIGLAVLSACGASPGDTYARLTRAAQNGDWETVYSLLDEPSQTRLDELVQDALRFEADSNGVDIRQEYGRLEGAALFARLADRHALLYEQFDVAGYDLLESEVSGDVASLTVRINEGREQVPTVIRLRKEDGTWKIQFP